MTIGLSSLLPGSKSSLQGERSRLIHPIVDWSRDRVRAQAGQFRLDQTWESGYQGAKVCAPNTLSSIDPALASAVRFGEFFFATGFFNAGAGRFPISPAEVHDANTVEQAKSTNHHGPY
jgi:hypothetical protein